jgi:hypothetical protein
MPTTDQFLKARIVVYSSWPQICVQHNCKSLYATTIDWRRSNKNTEPVRCYFEFNFLQFVVCYYRGLPVHHMLVLTIEILSEL